jgi:hypothetical protein
MKLSDFGQEMRVVPGIEFTVGLQFGPQRDRFLSYILDDQGEPVGLEFDDPCNLEWYKRRDEPGPQNRRVGLTKVGAWEVSTVFLMVDHQFGDGPPILWELMVFGPEPWSDYQERYTSRADAEAGHKRVCELLLAGKGPPDD